MLLYKVSQVNSGPMPHTIKKGCHVFFLDIYCPSICDVVDVLLYFNWLPHSPQGFSPMVSGWVGGGGSLSGL